MSSDVLGSLSLEDGIQFMDRDLVAVDCDAADQDTQPPSGGSISIRRKCSLTDTESDLWREEDGRSIENEAIKAEGKGRGRGEGGGSPESV
jgi:hypothetical protein